MEERKLNLNIPLMSVRRSSTPTRTSTPTRSSTPTRLSAPIKSPNDDLMKKTENRQPERLRTLSSSRPEYTLEQVTEPVAVPFHWEQIPGRRKDGRRPDSESREDVSITPRITPQRALSSIKHVENYKPVDQDIVKPQIEAKPFNDISSGLDSTTEGDYEKAIICLENNDDEDDDVYSDALETLSPTDSFSVNCSVSGVSGFDNKVVKPSGTFSTDQQTRDFMMSRFLPAAKAMTLEQPHYASRKQSVSGELPRLSGEQPRQIIKVVPRDKTPPPVTRKEYSIIPPYLQDKEDKESEDECDDYSDAGNITAKGCGFLPRLCVKNSLCLLNPVPGLKVKTHSSLPSTRDVKKLTKAIFSRSSSPAKKAAKDAVSKQKVDKEGPSPRITGGSNRYTSATDRQMISRTSPFRRSGCLSPQRNDAPQSPIRGRASLGIPKDLENLKANKLNSFNRSYSKSQELVPYHSIRRGSRPASPTVEKTLYVDTVNTAGLLYSNSGSSDVKKSFVDSTQKDLKALFQEIVVVKSSFKDVKGLNVPVKEGKAENKGLKSGDADFSLRSAASRNRGQVEKKEDSSTELKALVCTAPTEGSVNTKSEWLSNRDATESDNTSLAPVQPLLPPLLPKTPSESWLWRTLPSISSQNHSSHLHRRTSFLSSRQDPKTPSTTTKWENIVKSSYLYHDHVRYSEELVPHASQQFKS